MKRIYVVLGALCALIMFHTSSAFAQGWDVYRNVTVDELARAGKVLADNIDSVVVDYTEMNPLGIPGIQIVSLDTVVYSARDEILGYFFVTEGEHFVSCDNLDAKIRGIWFLAPGAIFFTNLSIGDEGELTQILGNGADQGAVGPFLLNTNAEVYNTAISGSGGLKLSASKYFPGKPGEYYMKVENCYVTKCGNNNVKYIGQCAIGIGTAWDQMLYVTMKNVHIYNNNMSDVYFGTTNNPFTLRFEKCNFLSEVSEVDELKFEYKSTEASIEFVDCQFSERMQSRIRGERYSLWWMDQPGVYFYESRPRAFVDSEENGNLVTIWPRESALLPEDIDGDEILSVYDLLCMADDFGANIEDVRFGKLYDLDESGVVDLQDLKSVTRAWLNIPIEYSLSQVASDPAMLEAIKPRINQLIAYLPRFYSASKAIMEDPEFGALITAVLPTAVLDKEASVPSEFSLEQNYPNPFNAETQIRFSIPETGFVELAVYDVLGQVVRTLVSEPLEAGTYTQTWDGRGSNDTPAATGVYMYVLRSSGQRIASKMVLAR